MNQLYIGEVVSLNNAKTIGVRISYLRLHKQYQKPIKRSKKIQAHNEGFNLSIGDKVKIKGSRPYSKTKRFIVIEKK